MFFLSFYLLFIISSVSFMERLSYIQHHHPEWATTIQCFLIDYPEFMCALDRVPLYPTQPIPYTNVHTLFQAILHYVCATGVRYSYAINQWKIIYPLIHTNNWTEIFNNLRELKENLNIQSKKRAIYFNICEWMNQHSITHHSINVSHMKMLRENINGIGIGCLAWINKYFTNSDDCIEYTDIKLKKGFKKIYGEHKLSIMKIKAEEWKNKKYGRIANLMVLAYSS